MVNEIVLLSGILLGSYIVTPYRSVVEQTDDSPFITSIGDRVCSDGVAVSQDWLKKNGGKLDYGDWIYIEGVGLKRVNDCMNKRYKHRFDVWVPTLKDEKEFYKKFKTTKCKVYILKRSTVWQNVIVSH